MPEVNIAVGSLIVRFLPIVGGGQTVQIDMTSGKLPVVLTEDQALQLGQMLVQELED